MFDGASDIEIVTFIIVLVLLALAVIGRRFRA
jgi:hypothetical protein